MPEESFRGRASGTTASISSAACSTTGPCRPKSAGSATARSSKSITRTSGTTTKTSSPASASSARIDNQSFSIEANGRINDFFTQTQWLPRLDHYWLGEPLVDDNLTWFEHSSAAYANIGVASTPTNPTLASQFELLPVGRRQRRQPDLRQRRAARHAARDRLADRRRAVQDRAVRPRRTRPLGRRHQRRTLPTRLWAGRRPGQHSVLVRRPDHPRPALQPERPRAQSRLRRRKLRTPAANQSLDRFPLYDELDDDSIEDFRRRLFFSPFGGPQFGTKLAGTYYIPGAPSSIDPKFDPRFYALRYGLQDWVTSPSDEIADDLAAVRMGMHHRLQTKRGAPGEERIVDWVTFDTNATWFPNADRDNAGAAVGLLDYDFRWLLGDRFSILSDGYADTFGDGLKTASIGLLDQPPSARELLPWLPRRRRPVRGRRPQRHGQLPHDRQVDRLGQLERRLRPHRQHRPNTSASPASANRFSRTVGANVDASKGNVGVHFLVEPRFLPKLAVTKKTGIEIAPAGAYGLE